MRVLGEALLSVFVISVIIYFYLLAFGAALFHICGLVSSDGQAEPPRNLRIAAT
jgi:hypothetical protein